MPSSEGTRIEVVAPYDGSTVEETVKGMAGTLGENVQLGRVVRFESPDGLLDGYKLLGLPETGINVDHTPGPRGPVTYPDLSLRQFVVLPPEPAAG